MLINVMLIHKKACSFKVRHLSYKGKKIGLTEKFANVIYLQLLKTFQKLPMLLNETVELLN